MESLKLVKSEKRYAGKVFDLVVDEIEYPSGNRAIREVAEHPGGAVVVALSEHDEILLVRQYRYPMKEFLYELPAGRLSPGEDPGECAARELEEETGYRAQSLHHLLSFYTSPGFCSERLHIFLAETLESTGKGQQLEEGELSLTYGWIPLADAIEMIRRGEIVDSKTICGIFMLKLHLDSAPQSTGAR
ncbi:MAG: NUDIX hydrolase [Ignavibacteria bacterium]|nr:NUDIX hydrolase [Ignavibacteria bacterium]